MEYNIGFVIGDPSGELETWKRRFYGIQRAQPMALRIMENKRIPRK